MVPWAGLQCMIEVFSDHTYFKKDGPGRGLGRHDEGSGDTLATVLLIKNIIIYLENIIHF